MAKRAGLFRAFKNFLNTNLGRDAGEDAEVGGKRLADTIRGMKEAGEGLEETGKKKKRKSDSE